MCSVLIWGNDPVCDFCEHGGSFNSLPSLWLLSTPRGQSGLFYAIWHDNGLSWHRVIATKEDASYMDPAFILEQKKLFPATFRQDFYCEFL